MFLVVRGQKNVEIFCRYMPRVREAITLTVDQTPIPILGQKYQLKKIGTLLHRAINEILPKPLIFRLHLLANGWPMGKDAVDFELPGNGFEMHCLAGNPRAGPGVVPGRKPGSENVLGPRSRSRTETPDRVQA